MDEVLIQVAPGRGHRCALASLYKLRQDPGVVTQNIDNLHQASGIAANDICELHGNRATRLVPGMQQALRASNG